MRLRLTIAWSMKHFAEIRSGSGNPFKLTSTLPSVIINSADPALSRTIRRLTVSLHCILSTRPEITAAMASLMPWIPVRSIGLIRLIGTTQTGRVAVSFLWDIVRSGSLTALPSSRPSFHRADPRECQPFADVSCRLCRCRESANVRMFRVLSGFYSR